MRISAALIVLCALVGLNQALKVTVHGSIENHQYIDRKTVYAYAVEDDYVTVGFTLPQNGMMYGNYVITGYKQIDETDYSPEFKINSGGIGSKHITMMVTSKYGKQLATTFEFYGDKV